MPMSSSVSWSAGPTGTPFEPSKGYSGGGIGSVLFDGNDYLQITLPKFLTSDFTIEAWVYFTDNGEISSRGGLWQLNTSGTGPFPSSTNSIAVGAFHNTGTARWQMYAGNTTASYVSHDSNVSIIVGQWQHVAQVRSGTTTKLYVDGTEILSVSDNCNYTKLNGIIGGYYSTSFLLDDAYLSNVRIMLGKTLYTSNFTPPTTKLNPGTRESDAKILTCFNSSGTILDASANNSSITVNGDPTPGSTTPFSVPPYTLLDTNSYGLIPPYFTFNDNGSTVYFSRSNFISYATLSTNYDLQTINSSYTDFSVGNTDSNYQGVSAVDIVQGILFASTSGNSSNNGKRMHVLETYSDTGDATGFKVYNINNGYDPTSMASSPVGSYDLYTLFQNTFSTSVANSLNIGSIHYNANGTKLIIFCRGNKALYEIGPFDAYDYHGSTTNQQESLSSTSYSLKMEDNGISINSSYSQPFYIAFNEDGTHLWVSDGRTQNPSKLYRFNLSTGFDLSTLSYSGTAIETQTDSNLGGTYARGIYEWTAGSRLFYAGGNNSIYTLSTASGGGGVSGYNGARGFWYGGATTNYASRTNIIDYVTIATPSNATDFGDLTESMGLNSQGVSNGTRGVRLGGRKPDNNESDTMDYITCATPGNAVDFGNLSSARRETTGASNGTRGLAIGGRDSSATNIIEYITISTTGNATDFGDCLTTKQGATGVNGETRALVVGTTTNSNTIEYIVVATTGNSVDFGDLDANHNKGGSAADSSRAVIALGRDSGSGDTNRLNYVANDTAGNAIDFGDLTVGRLENTSGCSDGTKGVFGGGLIYIGSSASNVIDYVTIQTTGNAQDFGDLTIARFEQGSFGGNAS